MKQKLARWIALMLCVVLVLGQGSIVNATEGITEISSEEIQEEESVSEITDSQSAEDSSESEESLSEEISEEENQSELEEIIEEESEEISEEVSEEVSEQISEEVSEEESEEISEEVSEELPEESESESIVEEDEEVSFTGLPVTFSMNSEMYAQKSELSFHIEETTSIREGIDCVENQILVKAETQEEAELYAKAFDGVLHSYGAQIATIELNQKDDEVKVSVCQAVTASADPVNRLPAAWPNHIMKAFDVKGEQDPAILPGNHNYQWQHDVVGSVAAWEAGYTGEGVKVAVLDTGIRIGHEDLDPAQVYCTSTDKEELYEEDVEFGPDDIYEGHGTHVSGIIAAKANNGLGGAGIAPDAEIYSCNVFSGAFADTDDIMQGIEWAIENDVDIINMSLGNYLYNALFAEKVKEAYEQGIAVFCAAGNAGNNCDMYPAAYDGTISIAALDCSMKKAEFSTYGKSVDYAFPGEEIYSTYIGTSIWEEDENGEYIYAGFELRTNEYVFLSGTSMASPVAAGTAAVILEYANEKGLMNGLEGKAKVDKLIKLMDKGLVKTKSKDAGKGTVDLRKALNIAKKSTKPVKPVIVSEKIEKNKVYAKTTTIEFAPVDEPVQIYYTTDGKAPSVVYGEPKGNTCLLEGNTLEIGNKKSVVLKAMAFNSDTNECSSVLSATYTFAPNPEEIVVELSSGTQTVTAGSKVTLKTKILPEYASNKSVVWSVEGNPEGITVKNGVVTIGKNAVPGMYAIKVTAKADASISTFYNVKVVDKNTKISSISGAEPEYVISKSETYDIYSIYVMGENNEYLSPDVLKWNSSNKKVATVSVNGDTLTIKGIQNGKTKITGTAADGSKKKIVFDVIVKSDPENCEIAGNGVIVSGTTVTYNVTANNKKYSSKDFDWRMSVDIPGVTLQEGKITVDKNVKAGTAFNLLVDSKLTGRTLTSKMIYITDSKVKSIKTESKNKNISIARDVGSNYPLKMITLDVEGGNKDIYETFLTTYEGPIQFANVFYDEEVGKYALYINPGKYAGKGKIKISSQDGSNKSLTINVNVVNPASSLKIVCEENRCSTLAYSKSMKLIPVFGTGFGKLNKPEKTLKWESLDPEIVTVDKNGKVTAKAYAGTACIEVYSEEYNLYGYYYITVVDLITQIKMTSDETKVIIGEDDNKYIQGMVNFEVTTKHGGTGIMPYDYYYSMDISVNNSDITAIVDYEAEDWDDLSTYYTTAVYFIKKPGTYKMTYRFKDGNTIKLNRTYRVNKFY